MTTNDGTGLRAWIGHDLVDEAGHKIGSITDVYVDGDTGQPEWLAVTTGLFGTHISFVPLRGTTSSGDVLVSPWSKEEIKDAPRAEADGELSGDEEASLYRHYGMSYAASGSSPGQAAGGGEGGVTASLIGDTTPRVPTPTTR